MPAMNKKKMKVAEKNKKKTITEIPLQMTAAEKNTKRKGGTGRRKIPIEKIEKSQRLRCCFSKRYASLFDKAHVLQDLCPGTRVAVIVQCPNGWGFKASEPDSEIDSIIDTYLEVLGVDDGSQGLSEIDQSSDDCAGTSSDTGGESESDPEVVHLSLNSQIEEFSNMAGMEYESSCSDQSFSDSIWVPEYDNDLDDLGLVY